jgi:predicted methyltransferase
MKTVSTRAGKSRPEPFLPFVIIRTLASCPPLFVVLALATAQTIEHEPEREHWQQVSDIFQAMAIGPGSTVADVGAGDVFLTVRLSPLVVEKGRVYAEDIAEERLDRLQKRVADAHLDNVVTVRGAANDPSLPQHDWTPWTSHKESRFVSRYDVLGSVVDVCRGNCQQRVRASIARLAEMRIRCAS